LKSVNGLGELAAKVWGKLFGGIKPKNCVTFCAL
jgi:hypothetical protein